MVKQYENQDGQKSTIHSPIRQLKEKGLFNFLELGIFYSVNFYFSHNRLMLEENFFYLAEYIIGQNDFILFKICPENKFHKHLQMNLENSLLCLLK